MGPGAKKGFREVIKEYAEENDWKISDIDKEQAILEFETDAGGQYNLYLEYNDASLVFSLPSSIVFEREGDVPDDVSTELLKRNADLDVGFWALEELEDGWGYVLYYDQKLPNKDLDLDLGREAFAEIIEDMMDEVEEFDDSWEDEG